MCVEDTGISTVPQADAGAMHLSAVEKDRNNMVVDAVAAEHHVKNDTISSTDTRMKAELSDASWIRPGLLRGSFKIA